MTSPAVDVPLPRAHLARPAGAGPWPAVVVLHELLGLNDDIRGLTDRLAGEGFLALAPDLFRDGGAVRCLRATFRALGAGHGAAVDDIETARRWLVAHPASTGAVGVVGFCLGGGFALLMAPRGFGAAGVHYGPLPRDPLGALAGSCPVVASYGARDPMVRGAGDRLAAALRTLHVEHDVRTYPGVGHSFVNDHGLGPLAALERVVGLGHDRAASADAWQRLVAFLRQHLVPADRA